MYKILILCLVFTIPIFVFMWIEYGTVCNEHVFEHLKKYSNLFNEDYNGEFAIKEIGYSFGVHEGNILECVDYIQELRENEK